MSNEPTGYTLYEDGYVHTTGLTLSDANEMVERYQRIFNEQVWWIQYDGKPEHKKKWDR